MVGMSHLVLLGVLLHLQVVVVVVRSCDYQPCADACREKHPDEDIFHVLEHCLQGCRDYEIGCGITIETISNNDKKDSSFKHPSRWIPTVLGCVVGVGVVGIVVYYARKNWKRRDHFAGYGFSKLRSNRNMQPPETELAVVSL